jgi:hypothetical protein
MTSPVPLLRAFGVQMAMVAGQMRANMPAITKSAVLMLKRRLRA